MSPPILFPKRKMMMNDIPIMSLPTVHLDNPLSFGSEFNLIRAVQEYGPQRIDVINKRLKEMQVEIEKLNQEQEMLQQLVSVASPVTR